MRLSPLLVVASSLLLSAAVPVHAQAVIDPSGHWSGAIHVPPFNGAASREVAVEIDLAKNAAGALIGTFTQKEQAVNGLPLANLSVDGRTVTFELKVNQGGGVFRGTAADATSISGEFVTTEGGYSVPFDLKRIGDARIAPAPKSAALDKAWEGRWSGAIEAGGARERIVLTMTNHPDGTATGTIVDLDGSNLEIPVAMTQQGSRLTVEIAVVGGTYTGVLSPTGELAGTWMQGALSVPLTFKRGDR